MTTVLRPPFYVISDTHFFHEKMLEYCGRPYDHEVMIVKRWQRAVSDNDTVLHLGDLFFGGTAGYERFAREIAPELPGKKYIILGNHDKKRYDYEALGFTVVKPFTAHYRQYQVSFDHYPRLLDEHRNERRIHVHGHIHNHGYAREEPTRWGNINVSVEALDYRPHRVTRLLNHEISRRNGRKRYTNSRHVRWQKRSRQKRHVA
jgi:calcineurin-like phosphoesterase family protein